MKKICFFILIVLLAGACKKEGGGSGKKLYLSKVFTNDLLSEEFIYSSDKKVIRRNRFSIGSGESKLFQFRIYEYENDLISRVLEYNKDGALIDKRTILYDAAKKVTRVDLYGNNEVLDWYYTYQYNGSQQLSKMTSYSPNPLKKQGEWLFGYDAKNNLVSFIRYYSENLYLGDSVHFTNSDKTLPAHWQFYEELMYDFPIDRTLESITANSFFYHEAAVGPSKSTHTFTQKTYNGQGYLASQLYKLESDAGMGINTTNFNLKYEYIE